MKKGVQGVLEKERMISAEKSAGLQSSLSSGESKLSSASGILEGKPYK